MSELQVHANEVRKCRGCFKRVVWLKNCYNRVSLVDVPETEWGKSYLTVNTTSRHYCPAQAQLRKAGQALTRRS